MKTLVVSSIKGGSGATTVTAQLATGLTNRGIQHHLVDLCPSRMLRLCLGHGFHEGDSAISTDDNNEAAPETKSGLIPVDDTRFSAEQIIDNGSGWLTDQFYQLSLSDESWLIIDCPSANNKLLSVLSEMATLTMLVATADPACYAAFHKFRPIGGTVCCLVNRLNPLAVLESDIYNVLLADYPQLVLPMTIHSDEAVREAFAHKKTVAAYAPLSQASLDYEKLASWLLDFGHGEDERG